MGGTAAAFCVLKPHEPSRQNSPRRDCALQGSHRDFFDDVVYDPARGLAADRDKFVGAMKIEEADFAEPRVDDNFGRIAGEARGRNPALRDGERIHHRVCDPRRACNIPHLGCEILHRQGAAGGANCLSVQGWIEIEIRSHKVRNYGQIGNGVYVAPHQNTATADAHPKTQ